MKRYINAYIDKYSYRCLLNTLYECLLNAYIDKCLLNAYIDKYSYKCVKKFTREKMSNDACDRS